MQDGSNNLSISSHVITALKFATATPPVKVLQTETPYSTAYLKVVPIPGASPDQFGGENIEFPYLRIVPFASTQTSLKSKEGSVTFNDKYFYIYVSGTWERVAINKFLPIIGCQDMNTMGQEGNVSFDSKYFYIYCKGQWRSVAMSAFVPVPEMSGLVNDTPDVNISFDDKYFYIYTGGIWHKVAISQFS